MEKMDKAIPEKGTNVCCRGGVKWYQEKIVEMVSNIENLDYLEFIYNMMISFKEKWGI